MKKCPPIRIRIRSSSTDPAGRDCSSVVIVKQITDNSSPGQRNETS